MINRLFGYLKTIPSILPCAAHSSTIRHSSNPVSSGYFNVPLIVSTFFTGNICMGFTCLADKFNHNIEFRHDHDDLQKHMFATLLTEEAKWRYSLCTCNTPIFRAFDWRAIIIEDNPVSKSHIDGFGQDCNISIACALGILQSCIKPLI